ncbi:MAG: copper resistance protein B [Methyloligella sp. ZOD6]
MIARRITGLAATTLLLLSPQALAQDTWNAAESDAAPKQLQKNTGGQRHVFFEADRLEYQANDNAPVFEWDVQGWVGGELNRVWVKSEGAYLTEQAVFEDAEIQVLYGRAISTYFDLQAGVRQNLEPSSDTYAAIGIMGLAPHWFELDAAIFIGEGGKTLGEFEAEYDILLTRKLILQPHIELNLAGQSDPEHGQGSGLRDGEFGLRLRYEIVREAAPYIGVSWKRKFGKTADFAEAAGEDVDSTSFVAGLRIWY